MLLKRREKFSFKFFEEFSKTKSLPLALLLLTRLLISTALKTAFSELLQCWIHSF